MKETDAITALIALSDHCFAYALVNGTVGVYQKRTRLWRVKVIYDTFKNQLDYEYFNLKHSQRTK